MTKRRPQTSAPYSISAGIAALPYVLFLLLLPMSAFAADTVSSSESVSKKLSTPVQLRLSNAPIREVIDRLCNAVNIAVFVDRRVDPNLRIDLEVDQLPIEEVFRAVAAQVNCEIAQLGPVVYLGPPAISRDLNMIASRCRERIKLTPPNVRKKYLRASSTAWPRLSEPREIVQQLLASQRLRLQDPTAIPHDLWPAVSFPEAPLADQLTLLLIGFDLEWFPTSDNPREVGVKRLDPGS